MTSAKFLFAAAFWVFLWSIYNIVQAQQGFVW